MADTQLPRFQVFLQGKPGDPFQDVGSVHAADPELAMLNARDVFVRRPECNGLWVVPVEMIHTYTRQVFREDLSEAASNDDPSGQEMFHIFCKVKPAGALVQMGAVSAASPREALRKALELFGDEGFIWWVFPASQVTASQPEDVSSMFAPASTKGFRSSTDFHTLTAMRELRKVKPSAERAHNE